MITISLKVFTEETFMNVTCHTRRRQANRREAQIAELLRVAVKLAIQKAMIEEKNGVLVCGKNRKLNDQILENFKTQRRKQRHQE